MQVRPALVADAHAIAEINVHAWQAAYAGHMPAEYLDSLDIAGRAERLRTWLARDAAERLERPGETLVAQDGTGAVVGYAHYGPYRADSDAAHHPTDGELYAVYVTPGRWRSGAGTALVDGVLADLATAGRTTVRLWVLAGNERACRFYSSRGFVADGLSRIDPLPYGEGRSVDLHELRYTRRG